MGPSVALRSYKALLGGEDRSVLVKAAAGAFRCALALHDERELVTVCAYWEAFVDLDAEGMVGSVVVPLLLKRRAREAAVLTRAEVERRPTASAWYLHARSVELAGEPHEAAFQRAAELGEGALACAARAKQLEAMLARSAPEAEILAVAEALDLTLATPPQKLLAARVRLAAPSRFARAAALSALEELASDPDPSLARQAMRAAAEHADAMDHELSWVEADRVAAALACWPDDEQRASALARLAARRRIALEDDRDARIAEATSLEVGYRRHLEHARATLAGYTVDGDPPRDNRELVLVDRCLRAIGELRRGDTREAELSMRELLGVAGGPIPRALFTVVSLAVGQRGSKNVALTGLELLAELETCGSGPPPRGFTAYALLAASWRADELAERLLRRAAARGETGAGELLASSLARRAWRAHHAGDGAAALLILREARALAAP